MTASPCEDMIGTMVTIEGHGGTVFTIKKAYIHDRKIWFVVQSEDGTVVRIESMKTYECSLG